MLNLTAIGKIWKYLTKKYQQFQNHTSLTQNDPPTHDPHVNFKDRINLTISVG